MLYLEDYLELIEHLPQELRDRLTLIRENDLKVNNSSQQIDTKVKQFFAEAKKLSPELRQDNYEGILQDYEKTIKDADEKVQLADQTSEIMVKLIQRLDGELEKFKLELEADHAGITEQLERRSLQLDTDTRLDVTINGFLNPASSARHHLKDRRRSEYMHRHHPYHQHHRHQSTNGYQVRAKLSQSLHGHDGLYNGAQHNKQTGAHHYHDNRLVAGRYSHSNNSSRQNSTATSPTPFSASPANGLPPNGFELNGSGHYNTNLTSFGNNPGFNTSYKNNNSSTPYNQHHSALSAALSSATTPNTVHNSKISQQNGTGLKGLEFVDGSNSPSLVRQNPLAAAASQAIAATQQLQQGRRTPSLKASFAAINAAGLGHQLDHLGYANRNALAPMAPDQQALRYNQQYGKMNGNSSPLYVSVTKSGRPSKRPKHHASQLYPDESPASISSDNSVFENSESLSSAEFLHGSQSPALGSSSPASFDYNRSHMTDQDGSASGEYQPPDQTKYCICRQISYGGMVACDNDDCEILWFHFGCVGITEVPAGKWYCHDCLMSMGSKHKKSQVQSQVQPQQQQKKRGRKEKNASNNLIQSAARNVPQVKAQERVVSAE